MRSVFALGFLAMAGFSVAQDAPQQNYPYYIDPDSVSLATRESWCTSQKAGCPLICQQLPGVTSLTTVENDCDAEELTYSCICENNVAPNITQFVQTLPYYICTQWVIQCVDNCGDDTCVSKCRSDHPCGAQDPYRGNGTLAASSSIGSKPATKTGPIATDGFGGAEETGTSNSGGNDEGAAPAMANLGQGFGFAVVLGGLAAGFAVLL